MTGRIRLETDNGPINLEDVGGDVYARAEKGPIDVVLSRSAWEGQGLDAETEIPLEVRIQPGEPSRRFRAELDGGGPLVRVVTTNGPVEIKLR